MVGRAVFLDRDGVINANIQRDGRAVAPTRIEDFAILPGVPDAVRSLRDAGFAIVVVTNQPDIATGRTSREVLSAMHERLRAAVPVDDIKVCVHTDADGCACRKPKPGMLLDAARERDLDLGASYMIGDRWRDIGAGAAAGCSTVLVGGGDGVPPEGLQADLSVASLPEASDFIVQTSTKGKRR